MTVTWRKSSRSTSQTNCVELANTGAVRDSKNAGGSVLTADLCTLVSAIKTGQFDRDET